MRPLIAWFVHHPLLVNLIMGGVFLLGYFTIADMRYEYNPKVDMGVITISTVQAGAGPEEIELSITLPLEEELLEVEGIKKLFSNSMENLSMITLNLDLDAADKQDIMRDIQRAVDRANARLPQDLIERPVIDEMSTLKTPIMEVHVVGDVPEEVLRTTARKLADALREVEGIASVQKVGYRRPEVRIMLAPEKMARLGLSLEEVIEAIRSRNVRDSGGAVDSFVFEKKVVAVGQFRDPRDVAQVVLRAGEPGNTVLLSDVAETVLDYEDWEVQSRVDGRLSIALQARKKARADELHTAAAVRDFVNSAQMPAGVGLVMVGDISRLSVNMLEVLGSNALLGLAAVLLLLWYFLELRFAMWVAVGIPFALCLAFLLLAAVGITINAMSLTAFIIVIGILVDDAVVVSENTARMRSQGLSPEEASIEGAAQVAPPVVFSALTTMLAFLPLLFLDGPNGEFLSPFPVGVILLLLASLFESQYLLPAHLAHVPARVRIPPRRHFDALRERYHVLMLGLLERRRLTLLLSVLLFIGVLVFGALTIRFSLFPDIDIDTVHVKVELPVGSRFEQTLERVLELEQEARQFVNAEDLLSITSQVGHHDTDFYGATEGRNHAWALITIQLEPLGRRSAGTSTYELVQRLQQWAAQKAGFASLVVQAQTDVPITGKPVQVEVISSDEERFTVAAEIDDWLRRHPAVDSHWTSYNPGKDVIDLDFNHGLLVSRGLTVEQVIRALNVAVDGLLVDELQTLDERVYFRLQLPLAEAGQLATLQNLMIINSRGEPVFLSSVAEFRLRPGEADIKHYFGKRTVTVYAEIDGEKTTVGAINAELEQWITQQDWPGRYPSLRVHQGGELEEQREALGDLGRATWICLLLILAALIALFNSLSQPLLVMLCLPFGLIGVLIGYGIQDLTMGMMAITGIVGLMGVLVNDSLVMLHTLNRRRARGGAPLTVEQVADVTRQRFRPIVITSVTTVVGLLPTAYGFLGENSYVKPLAMSMAWGVMFGGLVSLILLPVLYMLDQDLRRLFRGLRLWWRLRKQSSGAQA